MGERKTYKVEKRPGTFFDPRPYWVVTETPERPPSDFPIVIILLVLGIAVIVYPFVAIYQRLGLIGLAITSLGAVLLALILKRGWAPALGISWLVALVIAVALSPISFNENSKLATRAEAQREGLSASPFAKTVTTPDPQTCTPQDRIELTWSPASPYFYPLHRCLDLKRPSATGGPLMVRISRKPDDAGIVPVQQAPRVQGPGGGWNVAEVNKHLFDFTGWDNYYYGVMFFLGGRLVERGPGCRPKIVDYTATERTWTGVEKHTWPFRWPGAQNSIGLFVPPGSKLWLSVNGIKCPDYLTIGDQQILARPDEVLGAFRFLIYVENR